MSEPSLDDLLNQTLYMLSRIPFVDVIEKIVEKFDNPKLYKKAYKILEKKKRQSNMDNYKEFDKLHHKDSPYIDIVKLTEKGIRFNTVDECSVHVISFD